MTKKELLNKIEKQQEIIDALFSHLKLEYKPEEYIQKSFIGESKIETRIVVSERKEDITNVFADIFNEIENEIVKNASDNIIKKYKSNGRKTTHNKTK
ncbi:MAG: hypothetical protein PHW20_12705 [Clostridia bacterium]|nr:hypothetical protein [Clostridia bacterium]